MPEFEFTCATERIEGSRTELNLRTALSGECIAYVKYILFAEQAEKEGSAEIAQIFRRSAQNELAHAKNWLRCLGGLNNTADNLEAAQGGEQYEWDDTYAQFASEAREEGLDEVAELFELTSRAEKRHGERFRDYREWLTQGLLYTSDTPETVWICMNCGHVTAATEPPAVCPLCMHPRSYFTKNGDCEA